MARWGEMSGKDQIIFCILSIPFFVSFGVLLIEINAAIAKAKGE